MRGCIRDHAHPDRILGVVMKKLLWIVFLVLPMSAFGDVTFYGQCNYKGPGVKLNAGEYDVAALTNVGIPEDAIASVKVAKGFVVTLFETDAFKGRYGTLKSSEACLEGKGFGNLVSSVTIKSANATAFGKKPEKPAFGKLNPQLQPRKAASASDGFVTVYADCNFEGVSAKLPVGDYNLAELKKFGLGNNEISSVKVPPGMGLSVYENDFLRGEVGAATADIECLDTGAFAHKITSVSVVASGDGQLAESTTTQTNTATTKPTGKAVAAVYSECSYRGQSARLPVGEYNNADLEAMGIANNSISSIQLAKGFEIELFLNDFQRGKNGVLGKHNPCLVGDYADSISSVIVRKKPAGTATGASKPVATLYLHCNFKGPSQTLAVGNYSEKQLDAKRIGTNTVSSIKLAKGYQAVLYDGAGFNTKGVKVTADDACLDDNDMNEKMSSIIIKPIDSMASTDDLNSNFVVKSKPTQTAGNNDLIDGLTCVQGYVEKNLCDEARWTVMDRRCGLSKVTELSDGYLEGHVKAGNCNSELWNELVRRTANPALR